MRYIRFISTMLIIALLVACGSTPPSADDQPPAEQPAPTISLTVTPATVTVGGAVSFTAEIESHGRTYELAWDFGDGTTSLSNETSVTHTYMTAGEDRKSTRLNSSHVAISYA